MMTNFLLLFIFSCGTALAAQFSGEIHGHQKPIYYPTYDHTYFHPIADLHVYSGGIRGQYAADSYLQYNGITLPDSHQPAQSGSTRRPRATFDQRFRFLNNIKYTDAPNVQTCASWNATSEGDAPITGSACGAIRQ